jgi:aldehyde dehydrogenase (NAD+)
MTSRDQLAAIHADTLKNYKTGITKPYEFRCQQLEALKRFLTNEQNILAEALHKDLHRGTFEALGLEIMATVSEIDHILKHLKEWMEPQQTSVPALFAPAISEIHCEPFGLCLIIGAFNYPVVLTVRDFYSIFNGPI